VRIAVRADSGITSIKDLNGKNVATTTGTTSVQTLRKTERAPALLFYSALLGTVVFGLMVPWFWGGPEPTPRYYLLFVAMGVFGGVGHFLFTEAFHLAPASLLAPIMYLQLLISGFLGWWIFGQVPDQLTLFGMAIIAASGIAVALYGRGQAGSNVEPLDDI
jgi:drug/metabolite transporter (DMT)-like permease